MISILITTYKEPNTIGKALYSFLQQEVKEEFEILAACPDEETKKIIDSYSENYPQVKHIQDPGKGKPTALNLLFKQAKGNILILSDGDVYVDSYSINELLEHFKNEKVGAVSGHPIPTNQRNNMLGYWAHLLTEAGAHKIRKMLNEKNKFLVCSGYLMAIRSNIINEIPENSLSDDAVISNLIYNQGYLIKYSEKAIVNVKYPTTFRDWINQKKRSAGGYNQLKYLLNKKDEMRTFTKELSKITWALTYPKTIKEFFWTIELIFARLYLWLLIFKDINLKKEEFSKVWTRVESTK